MNRVVSILLVGLAGALVTSWWSGKSACLVRSLPHSSARPLE